MEAQHKRRAAKERKPGTLTMQLRSQSQRKIDNFIKADIIESGKSKSKSSKMTVKREIDSQEWLANNAQHDTKPRKAKLTKADAAAAAALRIQRTREKYGTSTMCRRSQMRNNVAPSAAETMEVGTDFKPTVPIPVKATTKRQGNTKKRPAAAEQSRGHTKRGRKKSIKAEPSADAVPKQEPESCLEGFETIATQTSALVIKNSEVQTGTQELQDIKVQTDAEVQGQPEAQDPTKAVELQLVEEPFNSMRENRQQLASDIGNHVLDNLLKGPQDDSRFKLFAFQLYGDIETLMDIKPQQPGIFNNLGQSAELKPKQPDIFNNFGQSAVVKSEVVESSLQIAQPEEPDWKWLDEMLTDPEAFTIPEDLQIPEQSWTTTDQFLNFNVNQTTGVQGNPEPGVRQYLQTPLPSKYAQEEVVDYQAWWEQISEENFRILD